MLSFLHPFTRWVLVASQAWTLALTWPLWLCRADIPLVHRVALPAWDAGPLIVGSLALILVPDVLRILDHLLPSGHQRGRLAPPGWLAPAAVSLHAVTLAFAMFQDELRVQPQVIAPALLLFATLPGQGARLFGLGVLSSMWGWAGLHKILSERYIGGFGQTVVGTLFPGLGDTAIAVVCHTISVGELAMGVAIVLPFCRWPLVRWTMVLAALGLHGGILLSLLRLEHNPSVWPWNVSSAVAAACLIASARTPAWSLLRPTGWIPKAGVCALLVVPAGFYVGLTHPYLSFALYADNTPQAVVQVGPEREFPLRYIKDFESFIPPTHRNFAAIFQHRCRPGHRLVITDDRGWARRNDRERVVVHCGGEGTP